MKHFSLYVTLVLHWRIVHRICSIVRHSTTYSWATCSLTQLNDDLVGYDKCRVPTTRAYVCINAARRPLSDTRTFRKWHSAGSYRPLPCSLFIMAFRLLSTVKFFSDEHKLLKRAKNALRLIIKLITKNKAINNN